VNEPICGTWPADAADPLSVVRADGLAGEPGTEVLARRHEAKAERCMGQPFSARRDIAGMTEGLSGERVSLFAGNRRLSGVRLWDPLAAGGRVHGSGESLLDRECPAGFAFDEPSTMRSTAGNDPNPWRFPQPFSLTVIGRDDVHVPSSKANCEKRSRM